MGLPITPFNPQQPDILGTYARLAQIKNAQQEGRLQQQQQAENDLNLQKQKMAVQQQQQGQQDEQIWNAAQRQANGDPVKTRAYAIGAGASQPSVENFDTSVAKLQDTLSQKTERDLKNLDQQHENLRSEYAAILKLPPEQQPAAYAAKVAQLQTDPAQAASLYGIPDVTKLPPFPGAQALQSQADALAGQHKLVAEAKDAATTRESNAKAALDEAKKTLSANPQDLNATIDGVADPKKYADLNKRLKFQMGFAQGNLAADPDGPAKVIAAGMQDVATTERETNPNVLKARSDQAVKTKIAEDQAMAPELKDLVKTTSTGKQYLTAEDVKGQSESFLRKQASQQGIPVVDKDTDSMLSDLDTARANQKSMLDMVAGKLATTPGERIYKGPENKLESAMQTDPTLAAMGTFRSAAIQSMRAVAGSKGLRINRQEIQLAIDNDIPKMTDTWAVAQAKVNALRQFLDNTESAHLTKNRAAANPGSGSNSSTQQSQGHKVGDVIVQNGRTFKATAVDANGKVTAADPQ